MLVEPLWMFEWDDARFATLEPLDTGRGRGRPRLDLPVDELVTRASTAVMTAAATPVHHNGKEA